MYRAAGFIARAVARGLKVMETGFALIGKAMPSGLEVTVREMTFRWLEALRNLNKL
jgi:hypothetical protein